jgi:hypothetical protein
MLRLASVWAYLSAPWRFCWLDSLPGGHEGRMTRRTRAHQLLPLQLLLLRPHRHPLRPCPSSFIPQARRVLNHIRAAMRRWLSRRQPRTTGATARPRRRMGLLLGPPYSTKTPTPARTTSPRRRPPRCMARSSTRRLLRATSSNSRRRNINS